MCEPNKHIWRIWRKEGKNTWECRNCWKIITDNPHMSIMTERALEDYLEAKYQYRELPTAENFNKLKFAFHQFYYVRGLASATPERINMSGFGLGSLYMGENQFL